MATAKNQPRLGKGLSILIGTKPLPVKVPGAVIPAKPPEAQPIATTTPSVVAPAAAKVPHGTSAKTPIKPPAAPTPALIVPRETPQVATQAPSGPPTELPVASLRPNGHQPRQRFADAALQTLADSIKREGVMQPLVVRPTPGGTTPYEIVAGERRWRAAQLAGVLVVPVVVKTLTDEESAAWALIENLQREDLNPIEKAEAFERMAKDFKLTHQAVGERVGLERTTVTNLLRLLSLGADCRKLVEDGLLSMGHARCVAGLTDSAMQKTVALRSIQEGWSVRRMESEVKRLQEPAKPSVTTAGPAARGLAGGAYLADLEKQITTQLKTKVEIKPSRKQGAGTLTITFHSLNEFDGILERLGVTVD